MRKSRRKAREFALKGLYEWKLSGNDVSDIAKHLRDEEGFDQIDDAYFKVLLDGAVREAAALTELVETKLDRKLADLSPIEYAILLLGVFEATHCPDVPYRVVINEAVELAKAYGGTDGHKYVNGVLDKLVPALRPHEVKGA